MTDYVWLSVTGAGATAQIGYAWDSGPRLFGTATDWVGADASTYRPVTGGTGLAPLQPADGLCVVAGSTSGRKAGTTADPGVRLHFDDGALIPVKHLADGVATAPEPCAEVVCYHVELPRHDVLPADGLPTESFLRAANRDSFDDGGPAARLHADSAGRVWEADGCARLAVAGRDADPAGACLARRRRASHLLAAKLRRPERRPRAGS